MSLNSSKMNQKKQRFFQKVYGPDSVNQKVTTVQKGGNSSLQGNSEAKIQESTIDELNGNCIQIEEHNCLQSAKKSGPSSTQTAKMQKSSSNSGFKKTLHQNSEQNYFSRKEHIEPQANGKTQTVEINDSHIKVDGIRKLHQLNKSLRKSDFKKKLQQNNEQNCSSRKKEIEAQTSRKSAAQTVKVNDSHKKIDSMRKLPQMKEENYLPRKTQIKSQKVDSSKKCTAMKEHIPGETANDCDNEAQIVYDEVESRRSRKQRILLQTETYFDPFSRGDTIRELLPEMEEHSPGDKPISGYMDVLENENAEPAVFEPKWEPVLPTDSICEEKDDIGEKLSILDIRAEAKEIKDDSDGETIQEYRERISKRRKQRRIEEGLSQGKTLEEIEQKYDSMKFNLTGQNEVVFASSLDPKGFGLDERDADMLKLFGSKAKHILMLETSMQSQYDFEMGKHQPDYWPCVALSR